MFSVVDLFVISTHTLTWSVTLSIFGNSGMSAISTHTLTWSVTTRVGNNEVEAVISTHTLTWSVTQYVLKYFCRTGNFNSHAHVERDLSDNGG